MSASLPPPPPGVQPRFDHLNHPDNPSSTRRKTDRRTDLFSTPAAALDGQSTFVAEDHKLAFGLTVPSKKNDDLFFTIRVPTASSWGAVGLGAKGMAESLILMIYVRRISPLSRPARPSSPPSPPPSPTDALVTEPTRRMHIR